jgi:Tetratricopeptide repeat
MAWLNPDVWLVAFGGFISDWFYSRNWSRIFLYSIPAWLLMILASAVFAGGLLNRTRLRNIYLQLAEAESASWQDQLTTPDQTPRTTQGNSAATADTGPDDQTVVGSPGEAETAQQSENQHKQLSPYAEMLLRRAHVLEPSENTQFYIGALMWQRGAISTAQQTLEKIAPRDQKGFPAAHAILAKICLDGFAKTRDRALFEQFQHHANIAVNWPKAFPDVLLEQANLLWQQRKIDQALNYLLQASKYHPDFYLLLVDRAKQAGRATLAQAARKDGIEHFQAEIAKKPKSESNRIQLAQLLVYEPDGELAAEEILTEGQQLQPSKLYSRALSELYRIRFTRKLENSAGTVADITLLERALQLDSSNPLLAQSIAALMRSGIQANEKLEAELNRVLASGQATMSTHAFLSELHMQNGRLIEARTHLEQVHKLAPLSIQYANNLAYLYAKEGRHAEAEKVAVQTLTLLKENGAQQEPFTDELFDTLGMIYQAQDKNKDAITAYEASLRLNGQRSDTHLRLSVLYRQSGNEGIAKAHEDAAHAIEKAKSEAAKNSAQQMVNAPVEPSNPNQAPAPPNPTESPTATPGTEK